MCSWAGGAGGRTAAGALCPPSLPCGTSHPIPRCGASPSPWHRHPHGHSGVGTGAPPFSLLPGACKGLDPPGKGHRGLFLLRALLCLLHQDLRPLVCPGLGRCCCLVLSWEGREEPNAAGIPARYRHPCPLPASLPGTGIPGYYQSDPLAAGSLPAPQLCKGGSAPACPLCPWGGHVPQA